MPAYPPEPFRIKVTELIRLVSSEEREAKYSRHNIFNGLLLILA